MLTDARALERDRVLQADVCVVGAGPAGITLASELARAGVDVCLLESGGVQREPRSQALARGENADGRYHRLERTRIRAFGGSANHWSTERGVRCQPLSPLDFESRPAVPHSGWPFGFETLRPFYERAQEAMRIGPFAYDPDPWEDPATAPRLPLPPELVTTRMYQLGPLEGVFPHRLPELDAAGVHVVLHATAAELLTDDLAARVTAIRVAGEPGQFFEVRARAFVLAGGGIENPRLLLLSRRAHPAGLGNGNDLVGRFFMEHPHVRTGFVRLADVERWTPLYERRVVDGTAVMGMLTPNPDRLRDEGLLNSGWMLRPRDDLTGSQVWNTLMDLWEYGSTRRVAPHTLQRLRALATSPVTTAHAVTALARNRARGREQHGGVSGLQLEVVSEQAPNPTSRVTLGHGRDRFGLLVPRLDWRLGDLDHRSISRGQRLIDEALRAAGIGHVERLADDVFPPPYIGAGCHHMGTTRMHSDPRHGVVDPDLRVHHMSNLFVAGSSVFPSGGWANPTLTVVALAFRLAAHLGRQLATQVTVQAQGS
jgi:choline dehydrogenase-like flavoprotein